MAENAFVENQWYAVLASSEVKGDKPIAFTRLGQQIVFWREPNGKLAAMEDRCPHRQTALSGGKVVNGNIECPFHGFQYDAAGECKLIPANGVNGPRPKVMRVKVFPVREAYGFIWVWNGEKRAANDYPAIPAFPELDSIVKNFELSPVQKLWNTHYTRAIENQLDVAHLPFVHATTIGRAGKTLVNGPYCESDDNSVYVWYQSAKDEGQQPLRPSQMTKPDYDWQLCLKFPNIWANRLSEKMVIVAAFAPVDEENTMMYVHFYHNLVKAAWLRPLVSYAFKYGNAKILGQDQKVVTLQMPKQGGLESGDKYIPADRPIVLYYELRKKMIEQAEAQPEMPFTLFANTNSNEESIAS